MPTDYDDLSDLEQLDVKRLYELELQCLRCRNEASRFGAPPAVIHYWTLEIQKMRTAIARRQQQRLDLDA